MRPSRAHASRPSGALSRLALAGVCLLGAACAMPQWAARTPEVDPAEALRRSLVSDPPSALPAPEGLTATTGLFREVALQWEPVLLPLVAGYLVESAESPEGPFSPRVALPHRGSLYWVDGGDLAFPLGDGHTRYYRLRAFAHDRRLSDSVSALAGATTAPPMPPPGSLRAYSRQPRSIPLVWGPAGDTLVTGYAVERSPDVDGPFEEIARLEGRHHTHYLDTGLGDLTVLFYRVTSLDPNGAPGQPSGVLRAVTKPEPLPPIGLRVEAQRLGANTLRWDPNVEVDLHSYRLVRWRGGEPAEEVSQVDAQQTAAEDPAVGAGEALRYGVIAVDEDGLESRPSELLRVESPGYDWVARASSGGVRLVWNARVEEGFTSARVTRAGLVSGWTRELGPGEELVDADVSPGSRYRYQIQLLRESGPPAPLSRPVEIEVPEPGSPFVEIRAPASRLARPEGIPR